MGFFSNPEPLFPVEYHHAIAAANHIFFKKEMGKNGTLGNKDLNK